MSIINDYVVGILGALDGNEEGLELAADLITAAASIKRRIWVIGNGGSMAVAQHFAQDMVKMAGIRAHAVNCPSLLTAYSNDDRFDMVFYKPLSVLADPEDIIVIFSCSGKSRNYIEFVSSFGRNQRVIAVVGTDGGFLIEKAEVVVHVKSSDYQVCESAFCIAADLILRKIMEKRK